MTRPGPLEAAARARVRDVHSRLYATPAVAPDAGVACPSASRKTSPRLVVVETAAEPAPEVSFHTRLCAACGRKMKLVRGVPIEGSGIPLAEREAILRKMAGADKHSIADCITAVIVYLDIRRELVLSLQRAKPLVRARQIAMWLARNEAGRSLPEIGKRWERDHSTVHHACKVIEKIIETRTEPDVADAALALRELFRQPQRESA